MNQFHMLKENPHGQVWFMTAVVPIPTFFIFFPVAVIKYPDKMSMEKEDVSWHTIPKEVKMAGS